MILWAEGKFRNVKGWKTLVSGGYGQHGFTLVAMLPRDEELAFEGSEHVSPYDVLLGPMATDHVSK